MFWVYLLKNLNNGPHTEIKKLLRHYFSNRLQKGVEFSDEDLSQIFPEVSKQELTLEEILLIKDSPMDYFT